MNKKLKILMIIMRQRGLGFELKKEFEELDKLSDEVFLNFEGTL